MLTPQRFALSNGSPRALRCSTFAYDSSSTILFSACGLRGIHGSPALRPLRPSSFAKLGGVRHKSVVRLPRLAPRVAATPSSFSLAPRSPAASADLLIPGPTPPPRHAYSNRPQDGSTRTRALHALCMRTLRQQNSSAPFRCPRARSMRHPHPSSHF
ncbi:hypothetical protein K438DRAFT_183007 [Mycena galopus ATCC 62051]|nr:hypothetical protein K438DRAFT_183007 [Mycena galopus ATCC 62051]